MEAAGWIDRKFRLTGRQTLLRLLFYPATLLSNLSCNCLRVTALVRSSPRKASTSSEYFGSKSRVTKFPSVRLDKNIRAMGFYVTLLHPIMGKI